MGEYEQATAQLDTAIINSPNDYKAYYNLAQYNYGKNYPYRAIPNYLKAIELGYPYDDAHHNVGKSYFSIKKYNKALPHLKYSSEPIDRPDMYFHIAKCYSALNQMDSALLYFEKYYIGSMPDPSALDSYYTCKAQYYINKGDFDMAIQCYEKFIIQVEKLRWEYHYKYQCVENIVNIYINQKNEPKKALLVYENALSDTDNIPEGIKQFFTDRIVKLKENMFFQGN